MMRSDNIIKINTCPKSMITAIVVALTFLSFSFIGLNYFDGNNSITNAFAQTSLQNETMNRSTNVSDISSNNNTDINQIVSVFPANFTRAMGAISSIQTNETGEPTWILSGTWELLIPKPLKINQTNPLDAAPFKAIFEMVKIDGSERHAHIVSDFNLKGSEANGNVLVLTGTATVLIKEGAVKEVPVSLTISNQDALKLWIYPWVPLPEPKDYHFGKNPIYGIVNSVGIFLHFPNMQ